MRFFNTDRGCLKGNNCELLHVKFQGKGKGKRGKQSQSSGNTQNTTAEEAKAQAEAKSKAEAEEKKEEKKAAAKEAKAKAKAETKAKPTPTPTPKAAALVGAGADAKGARVVACAARVRQPRQPRPTQHPQMFGNNFLWIMRLSRWESKVLRRSVFLYDIPSLPQLMRREIADPTRRDHAVIWEAWAAYVNQKRIPHPITWINSMVKKST